MTASPLPIADDQTAEPATRAGSRRLTVHLRPEGTVTVESTPSPAPSLDAISSPAQATSALASP